MSRVWLSCALLLLPGFALAAANAQDLQKKARARMKSLDFEAALPLLEQLRDLPEVPEDVRAQGLVDLGITFVNLGRTDDARKAFDSALQADDSVALPAGVPPKIRKLFEESKEARLARLAPPVKPAEVKPEPPVLTPRVEIVQLPPPEPPPASPRMKVLPAVLLGAGALSLGAGVATALASQNASRILSSGLHSSTEASALQSRRGSYAIASYVCYGAGAALGVAGAALFAFSGPGLGRSSVAAVVTPDFGAVSVRGEF
jgi:tetratricopeptide (TPR) repeat protein